MYNVLIFETKNNSKYIFDNVSGQVFNYDELLYSIINDYHKYNKDELINRLASNYNLEEIKNKYKYVEGLISNGFFYPNNEMDITKEEVYKESFIKGLTYQLFLVLTHECNLRCKYCIYSDNYPNVITYDNKKMTFEIAKKAVDNYIDLYKEKLSNGYRSNPTINFYGGEPLLEFKLIEEVVEYCKTYDYKFEFYITTNGTIMNDKIINLLIENEFKVTISLDGDKNNHDRNRVYVNNEGTFDNILNNLTRLHQEKIKREVNQPISFNCCYDNYSDMSEIVQFFEENIEKLGCSALIFSEISPYDTNYCEYCESMSNVGVIINKSNTCQLTSRELFNKYKGQLMDNGEGTIPLKFLFSSLFYTKNLPKGQQGQLGNACVPGSKIAVSPDGNYYLCEKMNEKHPIGNVDEGIKWGNVKKLLESYLEIKNKYCSNCNISRLCECCYVHFSMNSDDELSFNQQFCNDKKNAIPKNLSKIYSLLEKNPECLDIKDENENESNSFIRLSI